MCRFRIVPIVSLGFSSNGVIVLSLALLFLLSLCSAQGQTLPPTQQRTASWYADNPAALDYVTRLCRDDPGHLRSTPDCINAAQARIIVAQRDAERTAQSRIGPGPRMPGDLTPPSSPRYWRDRPEERAQKLAYCDRMSPEAQARFFCAPARAAAGMRRL